MNKKSRFAEGVGRIGCAILGACSSILCVLGYYPLVPAFYAGCCMEQRKNLLLYIGILTGMGWNMPVGAMVKYVFVLLVTGVGIRFYMWANHRCSGWVAGILAGLSVAVMNCSGVAFSTMDRKEMILGVCEGILVTGATIVIHYLYRMASELGAAFLGRSPEAVPVVYQEEGKMHALALAVDELSTAFSVTGNPAQPFGYEHVELLQQEITGKLCAACDGCAICWERKESDLTTRFRRMLQAVMAHRSREEIIEKNYVQECPRYSWMVEEAIWAFSRMELNEAWYQRLRENRRVIADQLDAMALVMQDWSKGYTNLDAKSKIILAKIAYEVKERGMVVTGLHLYEDVHKRQFITATVASKWGGGIPSKNYVKALELATGMSMRMQANARSIITKEPVTMTVYEDTRFYALSGVASHAREQADVNGDNISIFALDNGSYHVCLSDGMGSGVAASKESELVVDLIQKLMEAGFPRETAIRMMNSAMVLKGENDSYSTLDFAGINLYTGELEMTKIGAAASFVRSGSKVNCVSQASLPAGVNMEQVLKPQVRQMQHGDFLVMVTDGVLEYLHIKNPEEAFAGFISEIKTDNAGVLANFLMERVMQYTGGHVQDDMTIVVTGVWEK